MNIDTKLPELCPICNSPIIRYSATKDHPKRGWGIEYVGYWCGAELKSYYGDEPSVSRKCPEAANVAISLRKELDDIRQTE